MPLRLRSCVCLLMLFTLSASIGFSEFDPPTEKPYSLENYKPPKPYVADEPLAKEFSLEKAAQFLDGASLDWQKNQKCFTCHTNHPYLYGRQLVSISADDPGPREVREALEKFVEEELGEKKKGGFSGGMFTIAGATTLAINDSITTKKLHPLTKRALDHVWTLQQRDGGIPWGGGVDPIGSAHFGAAITSIAVAVAPEGYAQTEAAKQGIAKIRSWLEKRAPKRLYDKVMVLWASGYHDGFMTPEAKAELMVELREKQLTDGGWSVTDLGVTRNPGRPKGKEPKEPEQTPAAVSDGYATGLVIYALRQARVSAQDPAIARGIAWLKSNQRESGRWTTLTSRGLSNTGSVFAIMALQSCAEPTAPVSLPNKQPAP